MLAEPGGSNVIIKGLTGRGRRVGVSEKICRCYAADFERSKRNCEPRNTDGL